MLERQKGTYYDLHREERLAYDKTRTAYQKEYRNNHKDKIKSYLQKYRATPKGKYSSYRKHAEYRKIIFELTLEEFTELVLLPCSYCGGEGGGIDRIENSKGYNLLNCSPCCYDCNTSKNDRSREEFIEWAKRIVK